MFVKPGARSMGDSVTVSYRQSFLKNLGDEHTTILTSWFSTHQALMYWISTNLGLVCGQIPVASCVTETTRAKEKAPGVTNVI